MQNWRHAGRFGVDMVPLATDGTTNTAGDLNLGTAGAPWANLNIAKGGAIYIGGTEFQGGGGGSAVEVFEQKSHLEKVGYDYPLSNAQSQNESFMDSSAMVLTLGKTHLNTETTIYLDRDAISISGIDLASLTAWTPVNTGTTATNTTAGQNVDGTSIKYSVTATNTSYFMAHSFTAFSLVDRDLKVWLYPNGVTNLSHALIRLECATTTVYCEFQVPTASLTAATLNSLYLNMDAPDTTTASFNRSAITRVYLGVKGTATPQALEWSWDKIRSVDNRKLKLPVQMVCDNGTNQEFINITTATVAGDIYTLETISTYTHTISSSEVRLKQLDISNGQGVISSGATGDAALTGWDIQRTYMNTSTSGDLIISSRWYDESYPVATITNASTTVLEVTTTTVAAGFKSGDVVRLYKWEYIDQDYQSPVNSSIGSNFIDLTLTADGGTTSSSQLTLTHGNTSNQNLGGDTADKWRGIRVSADDYYQVEAATASQALVKATPTLWLPKDEGIVYPSYVHSHWKLNEISGNAINARQASGAYDLTQVGTVPSTAGKLGGARGPFTTSNYLKSVETIYDTTTFIIDGWFKTTETGVNKGIIGKGLAETGSAYEGWGIWINSADNKLWFHTDTVTGCASTNAVTSGEWVYFLAGMRATAGVNEKRLYINGSLNADEAGGIIVASAYDLLVGAARNTSGVITYGFNGLIDSLTYWSTVPSTWAEIETIAAQRYAQGRGREYGYSPGYIQKSTISSVSGSKLITATRLTRQDATNQNPIIYQRNAVIV